MIYRNKQYDILEDLKDKIFDVKSEFTHTDCPLTKCFFRKHVGFFITLGIMEIGCFTVAIVETQSSTLPIIYTNTMLITKSVQFIYYVDLVLFKLEQMEIIVKEINVKAHKIDDSEPFVNNFLYWLREVYQKLFEITSDINKCFGLSIVPMIVAILFSLTAHCYWQILQILGRIGDDIFVLCKHKI